MSTPQPKLPEAAPHPLAPSSSTVVSLAIGAPVVIIIGWILDQFYKIQLPNEVAVALGAILSSVLGYFANGGRAKDTA